MGQGDLPVASGDDHARAFERAGFERLQRRGRGSHILLKKAGVQMILSLPDHREVKRALLAKQIRNAGLTIEEYLEFFED